MSSANQDSKLPAIGGGAGQQRRQLGSPNDDRRGISKDQARYQGTVSIEEGRSPFKQPTEDEIFYYRDKEHERIQEGKKNSKNLKIWDKKTGSSQNPLKNFKHFGHPVPKKAEEVQTGPAGKKAAEKAENTLITEAAHIVMERKKQQENLKHHARNRETMADVVAQKKEIFLVTMTTKIIKEETEKLKQLIDGKKTALNQ